MFIANFLPFLILLFQFINGINAKKFETIPPNEFEPECLVNDENFNRNFLEKAIIKMLKMRIEMTSGAMGHR